MEPPRGRADAAVACGRICRIVPIWRLRGTAPNRYRAAATGPCPLARRRPPSAPALASRAVEPNLNGVWAKWERGIGQLDTLSKEVIEFGQQPHPFTITVHEDPEAGKYVFLFEPAWPQRTVRHWGAVIGEIVHDLRSLLDQLVVQLVRLNGGQARREHAFPLRHEEPSEGFAAWATREWTDRNGKRRRGPLSGMSPAAVALVESCQPYNGGDFPRLTQLHMMWNTDKHETLIPTMLAFHAPTAKLTNVLVEDRVDRFDGNTFVVELTVAAGDPPPEPNVDLEPHAPTDILFSGGAREGVAVIEELRQIGRVMLAGILLPASEMFPLSARIPPP
jgi:hypothetical protein